MRRFPVLLPRLAAGVKAVLQPDRRIRRMLAGQDLDVREIDGLIAPSDGLVLDVGAERGEISRHFAESGFTVFAFEPSHRNRLILRARSLRHLLTRRLHIVGAACSNFDGTATLDTHGAGWEHRLEREASKDHEEVEVIRLGGWLQKKGMPPVAFLKVDAEGHDIQVLEGYWSHPNVPDPIVVMFEFTGSDIGRALELVRSRGYEHFRFVCRWNEKADRGSELRLAVIDGLDPLIEQAEWGNAICSKRSFRAKHPLR